MTINISSANSVQLEGSKRFIMKKKRVTFSPVFKINENSSIGNIFLQQEAQGQRPRGCNLSVDYLSNNFLKDIQTFGFKIFLIRHIINLFYLPT